jgi:endonuclease/exonuclease/phosphatase (EEP) superfamily protein YafD
MVWIPVILAFLFVAMVTLPLVRSDYWTFRMLEYPRLQKLGIGLLVGLCIVLFDEHLAQYFWWVALPVLIALIYLLIKVLPYTFLSKKEMVRVKTVKKDQGICLMTANVLQDNKDYPRLLRLIRKVDPDVVFLLETDGGWEQGVRELEKDYPFTIKKPLPNTYGLLLYSRLPLRHQQVLFRVESDIPSIETEIQLPCGKWIKLYGLHPKPPVPQESLTSTAKDKELMKVALEIERLQQPCVVIGDLNDVAWSHTTELFRKVSGLLDPRRGRGFYSTFSAHHWWLRFPLDYIFCSSDFGLISMKRLPPFGSDHFAMFISLQYEPKLEAVHEEPEADKEEKEEAVEKSNATVSE